MEPISFHPNEFTMHGFTDVADLQVVSVRYLNGVETFVSCWRMSLRDILNILRFRRIYLSIYGLRHPPVAISSSLEEVGLHPRQTGEIVYVRQENVTPDE